MNLLDPMNPVFPISPLNPANPVSPLNPVNQQQILNATKNSNASVPEWAFCAIIGTIGVLLLGLIAFTIYTMFKN